MESQEFTKRLNELTANVRENFIEMKKLIEQYDPSWEAHDGLDAFHAVQSALYDFYLNGAHLVDVYKKTEIGTTKSCVYKSRQILNKKKI